MSNYRIKVIEETKGDSTKTSYIIERRYLGIWIETNYRVGYLIDGNKINVDTCRLTTSTLEAATKLLHHLKDRYKKKYQGVVIERIITNKLDQVYIDTSTLTYNSIGHPVFRYYYNVEDAQKSIDKKRITKKITYIKN